MLILLSFLCWCLLWCCITFDSHTECFHLLEQSVHQGGFPIPASREPQPVKRLSQKSAVLQHGLGHTSFFFFSFQAGLHSKHDAWCCRMITSPLGLSCSAMLVRWSEASPFAWGAHAHRQRSVIWCGKRCSFKVLSYVNWKGISIHILKIWKHIWCIYFC